MMQIQTIGAARTMSSREIAELTEKEHFNVLADIRKMLADLGITDLSFQGSYTDSTGRRLPLFNLPEDLTITLVSGYSVQMRHRIVKRWQELEARNTPVALPDFTDPVAAARAWADATEQKVKAEAALALAAPKVEFVDRYVAADTGSKGFRQVCKLLKANEARFREFLIGARIMYRLGGEWMAHQPHIDAGRFEVKTGEANSHAFNRCLFTPKGVEWVAGEWAKHQIRREVTA
jgi:phage antirepressor YoqD-like protein